MIFVDANVFMRFFVQPSTIHDRRMAEQARRLFAAARQGKVLLTTSDATLAEVAYILTSPRHYSVERPIVVRNIKTVLGLRGFNLLRRRRCFRRWTFGQRTRASVSRTRSPRPTLNGIGIKWRRLTSVLPRCRRSRRSLLTSWTHSMSSFDYDAGRRKSRFAWCTNDPGGWCGRAKWSRS